MTPRTTTTATTTRRPRTGQETTKVVVVAGEQRQKTGLVNRVSQSTERFQQDEDHIGVGHCFSGGRRRSGRAGRKHTLEARDCRPRTGKQQVENDQSYVKAQ